MQRLNKPLYPPDRNLQLSSPRGFPSPRRRALRRRLPRQTWYLFVVGSICVVIPIINIPLAGLSLSAPFFLLVIIGSLLQRGLFDPRLTRSWNDLTLALGVGFVLSSLFGVLINETGIDQIRDVVLLVQYAFWILIFVATTKLVAGLDHPARIARPLGRAAVLLALLYWIDASSVGFSLRTNLLSRNSYAFLFTTFCPFVLGNAIYTRRRLLGWGGALLFIGAVIINRSRGSWIAVAVDIALLFLFLTPRKGQRVLVRMALPLVVACAGLYYLAPAELSQMVRTRFESFENLENDKSYLVREAMQRKGWELFKSNPLIGVGLGQFRKSTVELELPTRLSYYSNESINQRSSHNSWIQVLAETGLAGSLTLLILLLTLLWRGQLAAVQALKLRNVWPLLTLISVFGMILHMVAISAITGTHFWYMIGLLAGTISWQENSNRENHRSRRRNQPMSRSI